MTPAHARQGEGGLTDYMHTVMCRIRLHDWASIRRTHRNRWMGRICRRCGATQVLDPFIMLATGRQYTDCSPKDLNKIERIAGGLLPMSYDQPISGHDSASEPSAHKSPPELQSGSVTLSASNHVGVTG